MKCPECGQLMIMVSAWMNIVECPTCLAGEEE